MKFEYDEDQQSLRESVHDFLADKAGKPDQRRALDGGPETTYDRSIWKAMADQGLNGLAIPEEYDGSGASFVELSIVLEETGAVLLATPFFATTVLAATALLESGDEDAKKKWLPHIASGEIAATLAEHDGDSAVTASQSNGGWVLSGSKKFVIDGDSADLVLVAVGTGSGASLFAVEGAASGLTRTSLETLDATRHLAHLEFDGVAAELVGAEGGADAALARTREVAAVALSSELVGVADASLKMSVDYSKQRVQFDRPIGSFQAIKHKSADMFIDVETSRAMAAYAAWAIASGSTDEPGLASMTLAWVTDATYRVTAQLLQILGGIGYTWEQDGHLYFKRARTSSYLLGNSDEHRELVAQAIGL